MVTDCDYDSGLCVTHLPRLSTAEATRADEAYAVSRGLVMQPPTAAPARYSLLKAPDAWVMDCSYPDVPHHPLQVPQSQCLQK